MTLPTFVKQAIKDGRNYIGGTEDPNHNPLDQNVRTWQVTKRFDCCGATGLHVEYQVNGKCRRRMTDLILEADGAIY